MGFGYKLFRTFDNPPLTALYKAILFQLHRRVRVRYKGITGSFRK